jgi:hypothetical protein
MSRTTRCAIHPGDARSDGFAPLLAFGVLSILACLLSGCGMVSSLLPDGSDDYSALTSGHVMDVADVIPAQERRGPGYTIGPTAAIVDHYAVFCIQTNYGSMSAHGRNMLELRSYESRCIEKAAGMRGVRQVLEGALGSLDETVEGAEKLVTDPIRSVRQAPKGLDRMVRSQLDPASRGAGGPERRQLAVSLGCDPETHNRILDRMLDEIELTRLIGSVPVQFIPYTGIFRLNADIRDEVASTPPYEINERINGKLAAQGVSELLRGRFCECQHFTTVERLLFMEQYNQLKGVENRDALLDFAVEGDNEADALAAIELTYALAVIHERRPIDRFASRGLPLACCVPTQQPKGFLERINLPIPGLQKKKTEDPVDYRGSLPVAVLRDGTFLIYAPYDCLEKTSSLEVALRAYRAEYPDRPTTLVCSGRVMPEARTSLERKGFTVYERVRSSPDWGETGTAMKTDTAPLQPRRFIRLPF